MFKKPFALGLLLSSFQPTHGLSPHRIFDQDFVNELNDLSDRFFNLAHNSTRMLEDQFKHGVTQLHEFTEDANCVKIKIKLPKDFKFDQHKVEVINHTTIRLTAEDDKYEITYYSSYKNHLFSGQVTITNKKADEEKREKSKAESIFKYSLATELNVEEVEVEYDVETATLTFTLPKKMIPKDVKTINVKIK